MARWRASLVLLAVAGVVGYAQAPPRNTHPGTIVDARNGDAIDKAEANAYAAQDPTARQACPVHKDILDRRMSDSRGNFEFSIEVKYSTYFAVYCANGFAAREVPANDNLRSGTRVSPDPVRLYPTQAKLKLESVEPIDAARQAITRVLNDLTNNFRYFRSVDAVGFSRATERLSSGDRQTVATLENRPAVGRGQPLPAPLPAVAQTAIVRILNEATSHFRYFAMVAEGPFFAAVKLFTPPEQMAIEQLRTRMPAPLGLAGGYSDPERFHLVLNSPAIHSTVAEHIR